MVHGVGVPGTNNLHIPARWKERGGQVRRYMSQKSHTEFLFVTQKSQGYASVGSWEM